MKNTSKITGVTVLITDDKLAVEEANLNYLTNVEEAKNADNNLRDANINIIFNLFKFE
jgi:hypothetical protein